MKCARQRHSRREVVGHLVVSQEEDWQEEEDLAGLKTTSDLVHPLVIVGHPFRPLLDRNVGRADGVPGEAALEAGRVEYLEPIPLHGHAEHLEELAQNGTGGRAQGILLLHQEQDDGADGEDGGREQEGQPEANVQLDVDHGNLAGQGAEVDGHVVVQEDAGVGDGGIDNNSLASLQRVDIHATVVVLLGQQRSHVGFEEAGTDAENEHTNDEGAESVVWVSDDGRS